MMRCVLIAGALVVPGGLWLMAIAPPYTWLATQSPVLAGWVGLAMGCMASRRLRASAAAGSITRGNAARRILPFLFLYPLGVAAASALGLVISEIAGLRLGHMTGLLPYVFAFVAILAAAALCTAHAILVLRRKTTG